MTDWEAPRTVEHRRRSLAFALRLVDRFTGDQPTGGVAVETASADVTPVRNASGYYLFLDVGGAEVTVTIDGGDRYVDERRRVVLDGPTGAASRANEVPTEDAEEKEATDSGSEGPPEHVVADPAEPLVVALTPTPAYAFPETTTLIRGHVSDADGDPVARASVSLREIEPVVETTASGEFALWVPATARHVRSRDGRSEVVVDAVSSSGLAAADGGPGTDPTLVASHPDRGETSEQLEVAAGTRTVHYLTLA